MLQTREVVTALSARIEATMLSEHKVALDMGDGVPVGVTAMFSRARFYMVALTWRVCTPLEYQVLRTYYARIWHRDTSD
jgi:hypothetical protein